MKPTATVLALILSVVPSTQATSQEHSKAEAAFKQLTSLVGEWEGVQDGAPIKVRYTITANRSALMEQMQPDSADAMITMYTVDGRRLIATHYCSAGNQPQMVTQTVGDLERQGLTFSLARVTGMKTSDDWHNTGLTLTQQDEDHITQRWTYRYRGKSGTNVFHFTRKK